MSLTRLLVPSFMQMLRGLSTRPLLTNEAGGEVDALLSMRLAADISTLLQVRFACFLAQEAAYRLRGKSLPEKLEDVRREGWNAGSSRDR
jgi:hypothetical protein